MVDSKYGNVKYKTVLELKMDDKRKAEIREFLKQLFWSAFKRKNSSGFNMRLVESLIAKGSQLNEVTT